MQTTIPGLDTPPRSAKAAKRTLDQLNKAHHDDDATTEHVAAKKARNNDGSARTTTTTATATLAPAPSTATAPTTAAAASNAATSTTTAAAPGALSNDVQHKLSVLECVMKHMGVIDVDALMAHIAVHERKLAEFGGAFGQLSLDRVPYQERVAREGVNALIAYVQDSYDCGMPFVAMAFSHQKRRFADHVTPKNISIFFRQGQGYKNDKFATIKNAAARSHWWKTAVMTVAHDARKKGIVFAPDQSGWQLFRERLELAWNNKKLHALREPSEGGSTFRKIFAPEFASAVWASVQNYWMLHDEPELPDAAPSTHGRRNRYEQIDLDEQPDDSLKPDDDVAVSATAHLNGTRRAARSRSNSVGTDASNTNVRVNGTHDVPLEP